jgi:hypothetical protein
MREHTQRPSAERQPAGGSTRPSTQRVPWIIRHGWPGSQFGWRHANGVAAIRLLVAIWLLVLGTIYCVTGHWWGALLFVAAGLVGWLAYQMPRWKLALDADKNVPHLS